jgi:hypothetical protein
MLARIIHFLIGAAFGAGGGYLVWMRRADVAALYPPGPEGLPWLLVLGIGGVCIGVVFLASAVIPRPKRAARLAAEAARREEALKAADAYYAERSRAADRDWRSGDLPPQAAPSPDPVLDAQPVHTPPQAVAPAPVMSAPERPVAAKPVATSTPPPPPSPFPSTATLAPIPKASDPLLQPVMMPAAPLHSTPVEIAGAPRAAPPFAEIRTAIAEGRLDEADRLLNAERETAAGAALAELTGLAGDHAAAAGRQSNAKWLWRLALKRFGEAGALDSAAARAVSESLRLADN